ncbi:sugar phosphate isomerase/epimerase [Microbacterium sp. Bi121]|uniref:sugar phosphate isomerase/epimerase family protein n=1 Tax=Microbacterium sp. Bi121 TaxID=2822348 RepID=UPI001E2CA7DF|nr:sugar phosphate isomerase/epimerase [Microbacterium sp. Bi121]
MESISNIGSIVPGRETLRKLYLNVRNCARSCYTCNNNLITDALELRTERDKMLIGAHGLVFTGTFDEAGLRRSIEGTGKAGFDLIEIPLMDAEGFDSALAERMLRDNGLAVTASLGLTPSTDLTSDDPTAVAAGVSTLERCIDHVATMGGDVLCGVIYSAMGKYMAPASERGVANSQAAISELATYAAERGIRLSLEVVNRYESNVFNTGRGALRYLDGVAGEVSVHLDSYHMNIEESDFFQPVHDVAAAGKLGYVHIGDSHRGYLGTGTVDFATFFRALHDVAYDGPVVFESFSSAVVSAELSNTLGIWRNLWQDSDDLAAHANRYIRDALHAVGTIDLH